MLWRKISKTYRHLHFRVVEISIHYFSKWDTYSSKQETLVQLLLDDEDIKLTMKNKHDALCDASSTAKVFMKLYDDHYNKN